MCSASIKAFKNQEYQQLKQQCLQQRKLFEDPEFPASDKSLFYSTAPPGRIEWKRPKELCEDPHLFVNGISSHDLHQGRLGNCWFVAACSCLALRENLWQKVIPNVKEQDWNRKSPEKHAGIFHFRFWCLGEWMDVVIDDRLPTLNNELIFCHSNDRNEFWSALLEKAYAKLAGCYEALDGGSTAEAIVDFTGAVTESIDMAEGKYSHDIIEQAKLFEDMLKVQRRGGLISCYIKPMSSHDFEGQTVMGLIKGHAYSVTAVLMMSLEKKLMSCTKSKKLFMIRLRNPWGKKEWNGAWSDESEEWKNVSKAERKKLGLMVENDGEFWMTFEDWCKNFTDVDICRIVNTSLFSVHKTWEKKTMRGQWTKNTDPLLNRSGGCSNQKATFLQNPQYAFEVKKVEDKVMVSLQQKDRRIHKKEGTGDNLVIGFEIFKVEDNREYRMHTLKIQEKVATSTYIDNRMVFLKVFLKQGRYVLIPTTFSPGIEAEFILRLFTDVPSKLRELKLHKPRLRCLDIVCGVPQRVSQVKIFSVEGLPGQDRHGGANPYVIVKCEKRKVQSPVQHGTVNAVFNTQAVFYRRDVQKPIVVQVWHSNVFSNQFLGQVLMTASPGDPKELQKLRLRGRGGREAEEMPGHITVMALSSDDLAEL
ncbi:calpain-6 [Sceloporus undulatus]|uniref:calpain-6 n=1 Tax=Sceloporus undulatus TaxID=8520 RepID=UPI001C4B4695|nr:calpain-6 [Sceloporus undulatus]XP_042336333.1 calpain-6 [Sceloporus undulatus]XP_042336334.1 calpain-6 [Sceloporus undulatus]XP_042336336.1 calpain-6 [Sceloporus undulatus]XP_042336337.1 calpain-6 [Sceloporus undulatus]XP_042336338.1 calpain-6 [Sceloporus undulatus]